jgi:thiamine kinase
VSPESPHWHAAGIEVRAALAAHPDTAALADARMTPILGGVSNFAWHAVVDGAEYFVRRARAGNELLGADLAAEERILQRVAAAGLAPPVLRCDPAERLLVSHWITPRDPVPATLQEVNGIQQVAAVLARLHRLEAPSGLRRVRFDDQARRLRRPDSRLHSALEPVAREVFDRLEPDGCDALCHHDVHAQNVVIDANDRLWLVDWEYGGVGDPVFDLASFASQCELPLAAARRLCVEYIQAGGRVEWERLELARWAFDYVQWLWYQRLHDAGESGPDRAQAIHRSKRIEHSLLERASGVLRCNNR